MVDRIGISFRSARRVLSVGMLLAMLALVLPGGSAWAAEGTVNVVDNDYQPRTVRVKPGDTVRWTFTTPTEHTVTDATGLEGWSSGLMNEGEEFSRFFRASGKFTYRCDVHENMVGTVAVLMKARPNNNGTFLITWASDSPDSGTHFDVLIQRPSDEGFRPWQTDVIKKSVTFTPPGPGTYLFKARVQSNSNPLAASGFSPVKRVVVSAPA